MNARTIGCLMALWLTTSNTLAETAQPGEPPHTGPVAVELPGDSLFRLEMPLETADGIILPFSSLRGKALLITLFYSECSSVCPMTTAELQNLEHQLPPSARENVTVLMVSLDAKRDTPAMLERFKQQHHIGGPHWIVARVSAADVRLLAAALGVKFRELPDHTFSHSTVITLTDPRGVIQARAEGWQAVDDHFVQTLRTMGAAGAANPRDGEQSPPRR